MRSERVARYGGSEWNSATCRPGDPSGHLAGRSNYFEPRPGTGYDAEVPAVVVAAPGHASAPGREPDPCLALVARWHGRVLPLAEVLRGLARHHDDVSGVRDCLRDLVIPGQKARARLLRCAAPAHEMAVSFPTRGPTGQAAIDDAEMRGRRRLERRYPDTFIYPVVELNTFESLGAAPLRVIAGLYLVARREVDANPAVDALRRDFDEASAVVTHWDAVRSGLQLGEARRRSEEAYRTWKEVEQATFCRARDRLMGISARVRAL